MSSIFYKNLFTISFFISLPGVVRVLKADFIKQKKRIATENGNPQNLRYA